MKEDLTRWFAGIAGLKKHQPAAEPSPEANARTRTAIDAVPVTLFEFDPNGTYTCVAGGLISVFGITPELMLGRSIFEFPKFVPGKNVMVRRALKGEAVSFTGIWPRGRFIMRLVPRFDPDGRVVAVVGLGYELTKPLANDKYFEQLLEALRQSEARFRAMCDCAPLGICVSDPKLSVGYVNSALCTLVQRPADELLGHRWEAVLVDEDRARVLEARAAGRPFPLNGVRPLRRRDGSVVWASLRIAEMRDDGELLGYVGAVADVTRERAASMARERAQQDLRRVIEGSPEGIAVVRDQRWIFVNRALVEALGYKSAAALLGGNATEIVHPEDRARAVALMQTTPESDDDERVHELRCRCADGEYALMELRKAALTEFEGAPAVLLSARNVTEHRKLQARLMVSERLLSVGTLAAGVAHEVNNPLTAAISNLDWVVMQLGRVRASAEGRAPEVAAELARLMGTIEKPIDDAREACARVRGIVSDLKLFSRAEEETVGPVELTQVLDAAVRMAWNELRHRARLVREYSDLPLVRANEARLGQVFLNLLINASQAIPEGAASRHEVRLTAHPISAQQVIVEVRDTGGGIPEGVLGRIFDPFFTTKPPGVGTGLGLSICQRIIASIGGQIDVESSLGHGTTFRVTLQCMEIDAPAAVMPSAPARTDSAQASATRARVLVIDDDLAVGNALRLMLAEDHEVELFTNARRALDQLSQGTRYDAILCDVMMPEMSGIEFHEALMREHPPLAAQIIFLTGGAFTLSAREFLDRVPNPRLAKPFDWQTLRALIGRQLVREA